MNDTMTTRERFHAVMRHEPFDRLPILEWASWWDKTIQRWHGEGLDPAIKERYAVSDYFGLDRYWQCWVYPLRAGCPCAASHGAPLVRNEDEYTAIVPFLYPDPDACIDARVWERRAREQERGETVIWFTLDGFFWFPRRLLGIENHLFAFYDRPELMHRINRDLVAWHLKVLARIREICTPDFMTFGEDMSYNNGPMLSRELFDAFLLPSYRQVVPVLERDGILPIIDSDGDVSIAAEWFRSAGLRGILPLERQAGCDIDALQARYPDLLWIGHYDKMTMTRGEAAIRAEFERLLPAAARGGFLPSVDHQTPPGVSLAAYRCYLDLFREYAAEAGVRSHQPEKVCSLQSAVCSLQSA